MKKFLTILAVAFVGILSVSSCQNKDNGDENAAVVGVRNAAIGTWEGKMSDLFGGETVTVTFTANKVSTSKGINVNIKEWKGALGSVWAVLDDTMQSNLVVSITGNTMTLGGDSTFILANFPSKLTKK